MLVSVKKKSNPEVEGYIDVVATLPELVKRNLPAEPAATPVAAPKVEEVVVKEEVAVKKVTPKRPSILNLAELLSGGVKKMEGDVESAVAQQTNVDARSEEKLLAARGAILGYLEQWRPRFVAVFEPMTFSGNALKIVVPTSELKEEIERSKTEFLTRVVAIASINGAVALEIEVNEEVQSFKPIKLEDRIAHIMELNPLIAELKEALDLDVEG